MVAALALSLLPPAPAAGDDREQPTRRASAGVARAVEIRVSGDAAALARVRITARELLLRLDVQANVKAIDEPETPADEPTPLVIAHVDLRNVSAPGIDIEDGKTRQELTRRRLSDIATLETGVESLLHVLYLAVESALQVGAASAPSEPAPPSVPSGASSPSPPPTTKKPAPPPVKSQRRSGAPGRAGLDFGPLLRLSSLGGTRFVPGGGVSIEPRADLGGAHLGLLVSGVVHGSSELSFAGGTVEVRPLHARFVPTFDWLISSRVSGAFGVGAGLDAFVIEPVQPPASGRLLIAESAIDPVLSALVGARMPIAGRLFLSALASLDLDLRPTSFVARVGAMNETVMSLPRLRGGVTLALSLSALGSRRFTSASGSKQ
jgi:hypothetical protein